ncbi:hypothetical protein HJC22_18105 [Corallococcus exiguus]|uniref:NACHT domain-containing protein n=1 Tax=Corallococcus TaxID=83461 RepID=UPI0011E5E624|nr:MULTISPECIES: hypothetical protein [Corallococcus]NNC17634.1 hypothetical protein [Corallococcus exiguus]
MTTLSGEELARQILQGDGRVPRSASSRTALAQALPQVAEALRSQGQWPFADAERGLHVVWGALEDDELTKKELGTPLLAASCLEAAECLSVALHPKVNRTRAPYSFEREVDFGSFRAKLARPRVVIPLLNDVPSRVFHAQAGAAPSTQDPTVLATAALVRRFLGVEHPCWSFERPAPGSSKMAALFLRALLEQWPQAIQRLTHDPWTAHGEVPCFGATGALDSEGLAVAVDGLEDKVRRFFGRFPKGRLLVPASQWREAWSLHERLFPAEKHAPRSDLVTRWWRIQPFQGVLDLMIRLGVETPAATQTLLVGRLREASRQVTCWNGTTRQISETLALPLIPVQPGLAPGPGQELEEEDLLRETRHRWLMGERHPALIEGGPGSGKTLVTRRLYAHLLNETPFLGAAVRVDARNLVRRGLSLGWALHDAHPASLSLEMCHQLVELARQPALRGGVWLIVDGLDEVTASERHHVRDLIAQWQGPTLLGARPLPNEPPGVPHVRVAPLPGSLQEALFKMEGKPGHWAALRDRDDFSFQAPLQHGGDRRRRMISDFCSSPLGVSLLSILPEEALGSDLDVPSVLRKSILVLLERAEETGRISRSVRRRVGAPSGLQVLGAAAWSMLRRGATLLNPDDLHHLDTSTDRALVDAIHDVLENSDLIQRVGPDQYQFSHKSLAELCAALHLVGDPNALSQLLPSIGEPGVDAVTFHYGALLKDPTRRTQLVQGLLDNRPRAFSSLALATRLLLANGPSSVTAEVAVEVVVRRLRFQSYQPLSAWNSALPGGLGDPRELWLMLERWAEPLRAHWDTLLDACVPAVGKYLRGAPLALQETSKGYSIRSGEDSALYAAISLAHELASRVKPSLPLAVLVRIGGQDLRERPPGPWALDLEPLFDGTDDAQAVYADRAASIWVQKVPPSRHLERLDVLSRCSLDAVAPVLTTVLAQDNQNLKKEALLRVAINHLEKGHYDEESWVVTLSFARRLRNVTSGQLLRQWDLLWASGLMGDDSHRSERLEPLYAEFFDDACGPARWRALLALGSIRKRLDLGLLRKALRDSFRAVRFEALSQLRRQGEKLQPLEVIVSLTSLDASERCLALAALDAVNRASVEWILSVLGPEEEVASATSRQAPDGAPPWTAPETPWEDSVRRQGHEARFELMRALRTRLEQEDDLRSVFELLEGPYASQAETLLGSGSLPDASARAILATGTQRQRRFVVRHTYDASLLAAYVNDADSEVRTQAQVKSEQAAEHRRFLTDYQGDRERELREEEARGSRYRRPVLPVETLASYDSFETLWKAIPRHSLPLQMEAQIAVDREERARRADPEAEGWGRPHHEATEERQRKPVLSRLRELYTPSNQHLLLSGLDDEALAPFSIALLQGHLLVEELFQRIPQGLRQADQSARVLRGTPHAPAAARLLCQAMLDGRLKPDTTPEVKDEASGHAFDAEQFRFDHGWSNCLMRLDGFAAFLPLLSPSSPEKTQTYAIDTLYRHWHDWERNPPRRPELIEWARAMQDNKNEALQALALRLLALIGEPSDALPWRVELIECKRSESVLAGAVCLVSERLRDEADLPVFRALLSHDFIVASEAVVALARVGGPLVCKELIDLLESPPPSLLLPSGSGLRRFPRGAAWVEACVEAILRFGNAAQAKQAARLLRADTQIWRVAMRHFRLPEHILFAVGNLSSKDPTAEDDNGYDEAEQVLLRMIQQAGEELARRVMLEASLWGDDFRRCFEFHMPAVREEDLPLLLCHLRDHPADPLALSWLSQLPGGEGRLDALWRETAIPWWR